MEQIEIKQLTDSEIRAMSFTLSIMDTEISAFLKAFRLAFSKNAFKITEVKEMLNIIEAVILITEKEELKRFGNSQLRKNK